MKNPKLHTVNKWNIPAFMPKGNLFVGTIPGQSSQMVRVNLTPMTPTTPNNMTSQNQYADYLAAINKPAQLTDAALQTADLQAKNAAMAQYMNNYANTPLNNPLDFKEAFSKEGMKAGLKAGAGAALSGVAGIAGDVLGNAIAGGYSSGAGSTIGSIGGTIGTAVGAVNPLLGTAINIGSKIVGGAVNNLFGEKVDTARLGVAKENIAKMNTINTNVSSLDDVGDIEATGSVAGIYKGGAFNKSAKRKQGQLEKEFNDSKLYALAGQRNNVDNLLQDQLNNAEASSFAFGGPFDMMTNDNMGAIGYGFMSDYLTMKKQEAAAKNKTAGISPFPAFANGFALGGVSQVHGGDFSDGLVHIDAGGSHSENPNDGVQLGVDENLVPNLVEEGETVYDDYVYSNRIYADGGTLQKFHLSKKSKLTFADISKRLENEIKERVNDPISKAGFEKQMAELAEQQERQKQEMDAERAKEAFEALSPKEQTAIMQQVSQQAAQEQAMQEVAAQQQPTEPTPEEIAMAQQQQMADGSQAMVGQEPQTMAAEGGKLYPSGGYLWDVFGKRMAGYKPSLRKGNTGDHYMPDTEFDYGQFKDIAALEASEGYRKFTDYVVAHKDDPEVQAYLKALDKGTYQGVKKLFDGEKLRDDWETLYRTRRGDKKAGIYHLNPLDNEIATAPVAEQPAVAATPASREFHAMDGDAYDGYIEGELDPKVVGAETRRETLPNGDTVIYHAPATTQDDKNKDSNKSIKPKYQHTMFGISDLGPFAALAMQGLGIGRPDTSALMSAANSASNYTKAGWMPIDTRVKYVPNDPWFYTMPILAQSRGTDRAIDNSGINQGSRNAARLANSYNTTLAIGNAARQQLDSNYDREMKARQLRGSLEEANQREYGTTSRFNAEAYNNASRANAQARMSAAAHAMDADAGWYNSLYGNVGNIFKNLEAHRQENARHNMIADMAANGLFGVMTPENYVGKNYLQWVGAKGGKVNKKKGKKGLTY